MRNVSHNHQNTFIGVIKAHVIEWRKREGWSRETVVQVIVETHEKLNGPANTGIRFDPSTNDAFERQKVNADRVFRWLDDETKDNNLLPVNFVQSIMAAMPMDIRMHCADELLRPLGLHAGCIEKADNGALNATAHLVALSRESSDAVGSIADLVDGATYDELVKADRELAEVEEAARAARADVRQHMIVKACA